MAQNSRHGDTINFHRAMRVDIVKFAKIGGDLTRLFVNGVEVGRIFQIVLANLELNPARVARTILAAILVVSDMEFDSCARSRYGRPDSRLFDVIRQKYEAAGYQLPRLVFWNVCSRTGTIPVKENDMGVALVSGFSVNVVNMVMSSKVDPYDCLLEAINTERYQPIEEALRPVIS